MSKENPQPDTSANVHEVVYGFLEGLKGKALEIGAFQGAMTMKLKEMGFEVTVCDVDTSQYDEKLIGVKCDKVDLDRGLPYKDGSFDVVLLIEVVEHLRKPYDAIQEISRVMKDGGALIISTPNIMNWYSRMKFLVDGYFNEYFSEKEFLGDGYHISPLHFWQLRFLLNQAGMEILEMKSNSYLGVINTSYPKIFFSSLAMLLLRPFLKPKDRTLLEGEILIMKARKR